MQREEKFNRFAEFLAGFVKDLNHLASDGWSVLVEGKRDWRALRALGYTGPCVTMVDLDTKGTACLPSQGKVVVLTDMDRAGALLAARCIKTLSHQGFRVSLAERRRLKAASRGVFRQVENLSRLAPGGQGLI